MAVYTVDYGHCLSGADTGAGGNGLREEVLTRAIGSLVVQGLRAKGHTAHPIQLDSANSVAESLNYRVDKINRINPNQSISIHINAGGGTGPEVWGDNLCKDMCNRICSNISSQFGMVNRGFKHGVESLALVGLYGQSNVPALLVECFFIDSKDDCNRLNIQKYADCIVAGILNQAVNIPKKEEIKVKVKYQGHIQNVGWQDPKNSGEICGTVGEEKRLEALNIVYPGIKFRAHIQNLGWTEWRNSGEIIGTMNSGLRLEAIEIKSDKLEFSTHIEGTGWTVFEKNTTQGTVGRGKRIEAIRIREV